jgi:membrane-bound lytic murein transglycosylase MltF
MHTTALCLVLLSELFSGASASYVDKIERSYLDRLGNCVELMNATEEIGGLSLSLVASLAYQESRFDEKAVSRVGARSVMQVLPKYACQNIRRKRDCNYMKEGLRILKDWIKRSKNITQALCRYNTGWKGCRHRGAHRYARSILRRQKILRAQMKHISYDFMVDDTPNKKAPN